MRTKIKQLAYFFGGLFLSFALAGFVAAQTTGGTGMGGSGTTTCPDGSMVAIGMPCPTTSLPPPSGSGTSNTSYTPPATPSASTCTSGSTWCPGTNGQPGWCSFSGSCNTSVPPSSTPNATQMTNCPGGSQVPVGTACPQQSQEGSCTTGGGKWCKNSDGASGYCSYSSSACPAYDEPSCKAQSGDWCKYTSGTGGWCATNGAVCPINDEASCTAKGRAWCKSTAGGAGSGWCAMSGEKCPANDESSCKAQGGEWCVSSSSGSSTAPMSSGWCQTGNMGGGGCPINDKVTCVEKNREWCSSTYGSGWCAKTGYNCNGNQTTSSTLNYTCSDGTKVSDSSKCSTSFTCSDGVTKVSDSSKCPPSTPMTMSWPQTEYECTKYKGVWCPPVSMGGSSTSAAYAGSCMMTGQSCPKLTPANMMTCWDNSQVTMGSSCPITPTNSSDCSVKGGLWCATTGSSYSSGWCTAKNNGCPKYPPSGKMTCPDNQTYVSKLDECPKTQVDKPPTDEDLNYKTCPDTGTLIKKGESCPSPKKYVFCKNGEKVEEGSPCPESKKKPDEINSCMNQGGIWCANAANNSSGYCSYEGKCAANETTTKKTGLTEKSYRQLENKKKDLLRKLDTFEKFFVKVRDNQTIEKITSLKQQIASLPQEESSFDELDLLTDDIDTLRDLKDSYVNKDVDTQSEQDQMLQKKALSKLKSNVSRFANQLVVMRSRIAKLEKGGIIVPDAVKTMIDKAYDYVKQVQTASSFDEARDAAEALRDLADDLNESLVKVEELTKIQGLIQPISNEIARREKDFKRTQTQAKRLKVDVENLVDEVSSLIGEAGSAFEKVKKGDFGDQEIADFIQTEIIDKLDTIDDKLANLQALTNLKGSIKNISASTTKYRKQIASLKKKNKKLDTGEMNGLLKEIVSHQEILNQLTKQKLSDDNIASIVDELSIVANLSNQLEDLLLLSPQSAIERELKKKTKAGETLKEIDIPTLEVSILRSARVATFLRRAPNQTAGFITIGGPRKINTTRGVLVSE